MRQLHHGVRSMTNQSLLISILFFASFNLYPAEQDIPELQYKKAIEAYNNNDCRVAIKYFKLYLSTSNIPKKKIRNINKAKRWCTNYLSTFIIISGRFQSKGLYDPAAERASLLKYKPNEAGIPWAIEQKLMHNKNLNVDSGADAPPSVN